MKMTFYNKTLRIITAIFLSCYFVNASEKLKELGISEIKAEKVFQIIDKYKTDAPKYLEKLQDDEAKAQAEGMKYFMDMPAAPADLIVQALLKAKDERLRSDLQKIVKAAINKPTLEDWTNEVLTALAEQLSENNGSTQDLLEIAKRNNTPELIPILENAFVKKSKENDLLKVYKNSNDKIKTILFKSVSTSLKQEEINKALTSQSETLKYKAARHSLKTGNDTAVSVLFDFLISENKEISKESLELISTVKNVNFDDQIKSQINKLGAASEAERNKAKSTLSILPEHFSKKIENIGLKIYKVSDNTDLKINFLSIIHSKIDHLEAKPGYIGVHLIQKHDGVEKMVFIRSIIADTPAEKANIPANSQLIKINDNNFEKSDLATVREFLKTLSAGTTISLSVKGSDEKVIVKKILLADKPNINKVTLFEHWKSKNLESKTAIKLQ